MIHRQLQKDACELALIFSQLVECNLNFWSPESSSEKRKMPRKIKYHDYVDAYDDYYDYDEDHDYDYDDNEESSECHDVSEVENLNRADDVWHCTICTYKNPKNLSACDMCGVLRNASLEGSQAAAAVIKDMPKTDLLEGQLKNWRCVCCTYDNPAHISVCGMCRAVRSASFEESQETASGTSDMPKADQLDGKTKIWRCLSCTYDNPEHVSACGICRTIRSASFEDFQAFGSGTTAMSNPSSTTTKTSLGITTKVETEVVGEKAKSSEEPAPSLFIKVHKGKKRENGVHGEDGSSSNGLVSEELQNLSFSTGRNAHNSNKGLKDTVPLEEYKAEPWMLHEQSEEGKNLLHLAIVGHVDAGKSSLTGRLLYLMGRVSQKEMHKYEREAKQKGKESFAYAWVLDESPEERQRGVTMTVAVAHFDTVKFHVVLLDSPGHKDFVPNMIVGASQADAAVLVVDASTGAFEAGMDGQGTGGQTKEHAQLIRSFGVEQLIVAINKMDIVDYSKERFDFIKAQLGLFLRRCGFKESCLMWIPMSVVENQNLVASASDGRLMSWYAGPHFLEAIDLCKPPTRDISRPLRLPISEVIQSRTLGQVAASGKLDAGAIKVGTKLLVMPTGEEATVKAIEQDGKELNVAKAGDSVDIGLQGIDSSILMTGGVLCHPNFPVPLARRIELKIAVLDVKKPILFGAEVELHAHHAKEAAKIVQILALLDPKTGLVRKKAPRLLTANQSALIEVLPHRGICIEEYSNYRSLGRVTLRAAGKTIAVGIVTHIIE